MGLVFNIYEVGSIGLHGEIEAVGFAGLYSDVGGSFVESTGRLKCCVLINGNTDSVVVRRIDWRGEDKWHDGEHKQTEHRPAGETARQ